MIPDQSDSRICSRCVMDTTVPDIVFLPDGRCSCCATYDSISLNDLRLDQYNQDSLIRYFDNIKKSRKNKDYDCIIGLSGGVDSSYVAYLAVKQFGLRPLAIHLDNGWNTELAVSNVEQVVNRLNIDLVTKVLDWSEFRDIQVSFLRSGISNIEIPTDHAIWATLVRAASKYRIPCILSGNNVVTESLMPESWLYGSKDFALIKSVHSTFGKLRLKSYPHLSIYDYVRFLIVERIKWVPILNYINFDKTVAKNTLMFELGWRDYGGKHYESIFTRFFHSCFLPERFGFDLRKSYLSALVCSGQISRDQALAELSTPPLSPASIQQDLQYVLDKLGISHDEYAEVLSQETRTFLDYKNSAHVWDRFSSYVALARKFITQV